LTFLSRAGFKLFLFESYKMKGILPDFKLKAMMGNEILIETPLLDGQVQPASLDVRLGRKCYRIRASFLPGKGRKVTDRLTTLALHEFDLTQGAVLEVGCVYLVELQESLALPSNISATANPKSSTGRLDLFTRVILDEATAFDHVPAGYHGKLYLEISPQTFPILVREGSRLSQLRFRDGDTRLSITDLKKYQTREQLVNETIEEFTHGITVSIDLSGEGVVGYRAKRHSAVIDVDRPATYKAHDFCPLLAQ
jgi:dCTP deaminase